MQGHDAGEAIQSDSAKRPAMRIWNIFQGYPSYNFALIDQDQLVMGAEKSDRLACFPVRNKLRIVFAEAKKRDTLGTAKLFLVETMGMIRV